MSAGSANGIGPVSVRYAAQIQELLYSQAVHRAAAEQEALRQQDAAMKAARFQPPIDEKLTAKIEVEPKVTPPETVAAGAHDAAGSKPAPAQILNVQV